jgi:hypothetical protein
MTIAEYLDAIKTRLMTDPVVTAFQVVRERSTSSDGYVRAKATLSDNSQLEFAEYVQLTADDQIDIVTYNYHWADATRQLIQRWDNTPHHPEVPGFPHHLHAPVGDAPLPGQAMTIFTVLDEIARRLK